MSKMDALRAMREARYEEAAARAAKPGAAPARPAVRRSAPAAAPAAKRPAKAAAATPVEPGAEPGLCGHRNMSGRTCTRELGHAAKSHRYS
ncbi:MULTISPECIES: hypothetical protein [Nocardioides]|uniref:hypothetical protein n=1 Tax=Nocardioides TaxID=1839 RepID=UPI0007026441|nr:MULTISPECIES: hypothetical protein [Nocardioides]KQP63570.1 hypothetical protein ASF47_16105 [Nocardioides sp. Leaf285]KQQ39484.1 hypothetical protein ASF50_16335 [Nocardioides sp. Leaf307]MCM3516317.1 hypothetical protein [Nocardioides sp. P86]